MTTMVNQQDRTVYGFHSARFHNLCTYILCFMHTYHDTQKQLPWHDRSLQGTVAERSLSEPRCMACRHLHPGQDATVALVAIARERCIHCITVRATEMNHTCTCLCRNCIAVLLLCTCAVCVGGPSNPPTRSFSILLQAATEPAFREVKH